MWFGWVEDQVVEVVVVVNDVGDFFGFLWYVFGQLFDQVVYGWN